MSTLPGSEAWRDAGLEPVDPDAPVRLTDARDAAAAASPANPEDHIPDLPRADLEGRADEADVVEQDTEVLLDDEDRDA
ncbi:hypothetical protein [Cellulomonas composti]|uniref:Uncharacterized protein n=1 Tax=Cellulomonas composti TaxID=266130 RepID=A0A511JD06_9CELL|nr:hypothetical protein [Cellulomonas composti]GEL95669.1 hypothetical protein CCO02nite_23270 [Cellulomonas composti]